MSPNAEAISAYRYRLREASRIALTMGDQLLAMSQDAQEPTTTQLNELRGLESSLDVCLRYRIPDLRKNGA